MNKKIIYIILLIVILGGIIAFLVNQDKIEYASDTNTNTNTPEITSRGTEEEKEVASNNQTDNSTCQSPQENRCDQCNILSCSSSFRSA